MKFQLRRLTVVLAVCMTPAVTTVALADGHKSSPELFAQAAELAITGNYAEAATVYRTALSQAPSNIAERITYANLLRDTGDTDSAIAALREGVKANDKNAELHVRLGEMLEINGDEKAARLHYQRALKLDPKSSAGSDASANLKFLNDSGAEPAVKPEIRWSSDS